jgi:hypothetical protein
MKYASVVLLVFGIMNLTAVFLAMAWKDFKDQFQVCFALLSRMGFGKEFQRLGSLGLSHY